MVNLDIVMSSKFLIWATTPVKMATTSVDCLEDETKKEVDGGKGPGSSATLRLYEHAWRLPLSFSGRRHPERHFWGMTIRVEGRGIVTAYTPIMAASMSVFCRSYRADFCRLSTGDTMAERTTTSHRRRRRRAATTHPLPFHANPPGYLATTTPTCTLLYKSSRSGSFQQ